MPSINVTLKPGQPLLQSKFIKNAEKAVEKVITEIPKDVRLQPEAISIADHNRQIYNINRRKNVPPELQIHSQLPRDIFQKVK